jgi:hypothetical protein
MIKKIYTKILWNLYFKSLDLKFFRKRIKIKDIFSDNTSLLEFYEFANERLYYLIKEKKKKKTFFIAINSTANYVNKLR